MNSQHWEKEEEIRQGISERLISYFIGKYTKIRYKIWMLRKEANESKLSQKYLSRICSEHVSPLTSPLALIVEIKGSGGKLLSQLFDGHPELHVHPHELMIGYPEEHTWPKIDLSGPPARWFEILYEDIVSQYNREGYKEEKEDEQTFPFVFISSLQREIFLRYVDSVHSKRRRDIFDAYMTSYFGAWLNNQNYYGSKKFITACMPKLWAIKDDAESFFEVYPDGRLISLVRDPKAWFQSARRMWPDSYVDVGLASSEWSESAQTMLWNRERYGDRVCLIQLEDLIGKTEKVMRFLAESLGIEFADILLTPTFNKFPVKASINFNAKDQNIEHSLLSTEKTVTEHELGTIGRQTSEIYSLVLRETVKFK